MNSKLNENDIQIVSAISNQLHQEHKRNTYYDPNAMIESQNYYAVTKLHALQTQPRDHCTDTNQILHIDTHHTTEITEIHLNGLNSNVTPSLTKYWFFLSYPSIQIPSQYPTPPSFKYIFHMHHSHHIMHKTLAPTWSQTSWKLEQSSPTPHSSNSPIQGISLLIILSKKGGEPTMAT